jgi:hypothetical protein
MLLLCLVFLVLLYLVFSFSLSSVVLSLALSLPFSLPSVFCLLSFCLLSLSWSVCLSHWHCRCYCLGSYCADTATKVVCPAGMLVHNLVLLDVCVHSY